MMKINRKQMLLFITASSMAMGGGNNCSALCIDSDILITVQQSTMNCKRFKPSMDVLSSPVTKSLF